MKRGVGRIPQRFTQPLDRVVDADIEVYKSIGRPDPSAQLFPRHDLTWMLQQNLKDLEGLILQLDLDTLLTQFSRAEIRFEHAKANCTVC